MQSQQQAEVSMEGSADALPPAPACVPISDQDAVPVLPMLDGDFLEQALHLSPSQLAVRACADLSHVSTCANTPA